MNHMDADYKLYPGTNDVVFKILFTSNMDYLRSFLSAYLGISESDFADLKVLNPEIPPEYVKDKFSRLDILAEAAGKKMNVEMQNLSQDYYDARSLYYWAKMFVDSLRSGDDYYEVPTCITLGILNFIMFKEEDAEFHSRFRLYEENRKTLLTDKLDMHFVELPKVSKLIGQETDMQKQWAKLLLAETKEELNMIEQNTNSSVIKNAAGTIRDISADERNKALLWAREKSIRDEAAALHYAEKKFRAEGRAEGRAEERKKLIAKFKAAGASEEMIEAALNMND